MQLNALTATSPIDGRYRSKTDALSSYFSEYALIQYRVRVEVEYFIALVELPLPQLAGFDTSRIEELRGIYREFSEADAQRVKEFERTINHDVKSVEYLIKEKMDEMGMGDFKEFVHFGLTSQDINNTAVPLSIKEAHFNVVLPKVQAIVETLRGFAQDWKHVAMLAKTHGQPASPTTMGKEFQVFVERIERQLQRLESVPFSCKFGGATGNFNAHKLAYGEFDWRAFGKKFTADYLGLERQAYTTQIEHYDDMAALYQNYMRINNILVDLCRDIWTYIMMEYFKQKVNKNEVGSSAMPHKVNPIDFENAEGNLGIANALYDHLANKLPISRLQRDLTDSTVLRNVGVPVGHSLIALTSIEKGLGKLLLNEAAVAQDLENNWMVVAEAIQTVLRREQYPQPYEKLKDLTRTNAAITPALIHEFIDTLEVNDAIKAELKTITPSNYIGYTVA